MSVLQPGAFSESQIVITHHSTPEIPHEEFRPSSNKWIKNVMYMQPWSSTPSLEEGEAVAELKR